MVPALLVGAGLVPDLDLLVGSHSGITHSLGAAAIAGMLVAAGPWRGRWRLGLAVFAAYGSHVLLDWLSQDTSVPIGIMALWPLSREYWHAPFSLFLATDRRFWLDGFWARNLLSIAWELLVFIPPAAIVYRRRVRVAAAAASVRPPER